MLGLFRRFAKSWIASGIMGLIMLAFLMLGTGSMRDVFRFHSGDAVVQAGSRVVTSQQFQKLFDDALQSQEQQGQTSISTDQAVEAGLDQELLSRLSVETAYSEMLRRSGVRPSGSVIAAELTRAAQSGDSELAQLYNPVTGRFDPDMLNRFLQSTGQTQNDFQRELRDSVANMEFGSAVSNGFHAPRIYGAVEAALALESRDVSYFVLPLTSVPAPPAPTDAELQAFLKQNSQRFMLPERRTLAIVRFSAKALAPTMPADPAAVQQQFQADPAKYGKPELRSLVEIALKDPKNAPAVAAALARGEDPNAVARSVGVDAVTYTNQPQSAVTDRKAAAAAFAMRAGQVSGPVQGDFGTVILKVASITPGQAPSLAAARPQIVADLRRQEALDKVDDITQKFEDARQSGASLAKAAAAVGAAVATVGPVTADGKDIATGQPDPLVSPKLLKTAFALPQGGDSDVEEDADKGEYYAVHVDQVIAPSPPALTDKGVRAALTAYYRDQEVGQALQKKALAAQASMARGQSLDAAAAADGARVMRQAGLRRIAETEYDKTLGPQLMQQAFAVKAGASFVAPSAPLQGLVVGRVDAVHAADASQIGEVLPALGQQMDRAYLDGLAATVHEAAVKSVKPTTDLALARQAVGVDAATLARLAPQGGEKGGAKGAGLAQ